MTLTTSAAAELEGATLDRLRTVFRSRAEYERALQQMTLKERLTNWQPTNEFEQNLQFHLGKGEKSKLRVTSYVVSDHGNTLTVYAAYGFTNDRKLLTRHGYANDSGGFIEFVSTPQGVGIAFRSVLDHYRTRYVAITLLLSLLFLLPGVVFAGFCYISHRSDIRSFQSKILPALLETCERKES